MNLNRKNMILLIAGGFVALILVCILVVGLVDGIWPWDGITAYTRLLDPTPEPTEPEVTDPEVTDPEDGIDESGKGDPEDEGPDATNPTGNTLPDEDKIQVGTEVDGPTTPTGGTESTNPSGSTEPTTNNNPYGDDFVGSAEGVYGW